MDILEYCKKNKIFTISFTGFAKKHIQKKADLNLNLEVKNYGVSEDLFQVIMHMLSQSIRLKFIKNTKKTIL